MDSELNLFIRSVYEKTGIDLVVFSDGMKFLASTTPNVDVLPPSDKDFTGIYPDIMTGNTYFRFKYKNASLVGYVHGVGLVEKNYAELLSDLLEGLSGRELQLTEEECLKSILLGEFNRPQIQQFQKRFNLSDCPSYALAISADGVSRADLMTILSTFTEPTKEDSFDRAVFIEDGSYAYIRFNPSDADYASANDFATYLAQSVEEETGVCPKIGVGVPVKTLSDLSASYQQGVMAIRMCSVMNAKGAVHSFKEYLLLKMLEDLPKFKLSEYLDVLTGENAKEIFSDAEMTNTAEEFLENNLNVSETSRKLFLHRNTLMYRLDKIESETGLNIRKFSDAVTFRLVTILYKLKK